MTPLHVILQHKLVAILRGVAPGDVLAVAKALHAGGIRVLEITLNSQNALAQLEQLRHALGDDMLIGAGTVLDAADAEAAIGAGARFLISPVVDAAVICTAKDRGVVSIPGAYTPTEILQAHRSGGDIIKVFPAADAAYIKNVLAPLNFVRLMPTGSIQLSNIGQFRQSGAVAFGIGSALVGKKETADEAYFTTLTETARRFVQAFTT